MAGCLKINEMSEKTNYQIVPFPKSRRLVTDIGWMAHNKNTIRGLLEFDVTRPLGILKAHKEKTGERLSFTGYLACCAGQAIGKNRYLHAYRDFIGRLVLFDEVDISVLIEIEREGKKFPIGHIVRAANKKRFREFHNEIRAAQGKPMDDGQVSQLFSIAQWPGFVRRFLFQLLSRHPHMKKKYTGTVSLSAVGMFGTGGGWGIALPSHTLGITVGGIAEKPGVYEGRIEARKFLNVTLDFDHDIVDGAPAARFAQRFRDIVEGGEELILGERNSYRY
jgi:pyruvate/2-oxoglutarate dehydrogenase complex dihydrolipoamide acyltransferase (E2) component